MKSTFRATTPDDQEGLSKLLAGAFDNAPGTSLLDPQVMAWKYWAVRGDWTEPRSYVLEMDGRLVAHAGIWPATLGDMRGVQMIDWAAAKDSPGVGMSIVQKFARMFDFIYSIGGSDMTRKVLPAFGFVEHTRAWTAARPLRPFRQILSHQHRNWKMGARLVRNWSWSKSPARHASSAWKAYDLRPSQIGEVDGAAFNPRNTAFFEYLLRCPAVKYRLYGIRNQHGLQGHFALGILRGQARVAGVWLRKFSEENVRAAYALAQEIALGSKEACEIAASGTEGLSGQAAVETGLRMVRSTPVYLLNKHVNFKLSENFQFQMSDDDAAFLNTGTASFYT